MRPNETTTMHTTAASKKEVASPTATSKKEVTSEDVTIAIEVVKSTQLKLKQCTNAVASAETNLAEAKKNLALAKKKLSEAKRREKNERYVLKKAVRNAKASLKEAMK